MSNNLSISLKKQEVIEIDPETELFLGNQMYEMMNSDQKAIIDLILSSIDNRLINQTNRNNLFFIDGPGTKN